MPYTLNFMVLDVTHSNKIGGGEYVQRSRVERAILKPFHIQASPDGRSPNFILYQI